MDSVQLRYALINSVNVSTTVCAKNQLSEINSSEFAIICNNQSSDERGMHWLAFYKDKEGLEFFDSFGMDLQFYGVEFVKFASKHGKTVKTSTEQYQSNNSNLCGGYCLYFLIQRNNGLLYESIINTFSLNNTKLNDFTVKKFVCTNFIFPKFSKCGISCNGKCSKSFNSYCFQKNNHCQRVSQDLISE